MPARNEERRLGPLFATLRTTASADVARAGLQLLEVIVVDDASSDRTAALLHEEAAASPLVKPLVQALQARGKGAAVAAGVRAASGELTLIVDADLSVPLDDVVKLAASLSAGADIAIGSRDVPGSVIENAPRHRVWLGRSFNFAVRRLTRLSFRDTQCGFKLLPTATASALIANQLVPGLAYDVELLARARAAGLVTKEVPVRYVHGRDSGVKPLRAAPRMAVDVSRIALRLGQRRGGRPLVASANHSERYARREPDTAPDESGLELHGRRE